VDLSRKFLLCHSTKSTALETCSRYAFSDVRCSFLWRCTLTLNMGVDFGSVGARVAGLAVRSITLMEFA
jgi:hypothetical protein